MSQLDTIEHSCGRGNECCLKKEHDALADILDDAHYDSWSQGYEEGRSEGYEEGYEDGAGE